jgi:inward rectifier potassium channel
MLTCWPAINLGFAALYALGPGAVANTASGSFTDIFFFSVETLATVGYGVMAPATPYGHIVSATEIVIGTIFTGLLFVRFSRPKAKIIASDTAVVTLYNGQPTLMIRIVNGRLTVMSNASVRLFALVAGQSTEGVAFRRIHDLHLLQSHLPLFIMPWTVMHVIDDASPLHGYDAQTLIQTQARIFLTIEARDHALSALVQDVKDYPPEHIRFADAVTLDNTGRATADLTRISLLEPDNRPSDTIK